MAAVDNGDVPVVNSDNAISKMQSAFDLQLEKMAKVTEIKADYSASKNALQQGQQ